MKECKRKIGEVVEEVGERRGAKKNIFRFCINFKSGKNLICISPQRGLIFDTKICRLTDKSFPTARVALRQEASFQ